MNNKLNNLTMALIFRTCLSAGVLAVTSSDFAATQPEISFQIIATFDYPGSTNTLALGVNNQGDCAGEYFDSSNIIRGFVRFANGKFSAPIVDPNGAGTLTSLLGINSARIGCGTYEDSTTDHGFFLSGRTYTTFDVSGASNTSLKGINNAGDVVGSAVISTLTGFINVAGATTLFSVPGSGGETFPESVNDADEVVGYYLDSQLAIHGFFRAADGTLKYPIDFPGAILTETKGVNDNGLIVGSYFDSSGGGGHALLLKLPGTFISYDYPGAVSTGFSGINKSGVICGSFYDGSVDHGLLARIVRQK